MSEPVKPFPFREAAELPGSTPERPELPPSGQAAQPVNERLNETAQAVGSTMGNAVEQVRQLPRRMQELKQRFTVIRGRTREEAAAAAAEVRQSAEQKLAETRIRAQQLAREYPLQVVLGCALAAFVLGFALRIWRSNHAE